MSEETKEAAPAPTKGVPVTLDRVRYLRYPLSVLRRMEGKMSIAEMVHAGLITDDPGITEEQVDNMISLDMLSDLRDPLVKATGGLVDLAELYPKMFPGIATKGDGEDRPTIATEPDSQE